METTTTITTGTMSISDAILTSSIPKTITYTVDTVPELTADVKTVPDFWTTYRPYIYNKYNKDEAAASPIQIKNVKIIEDKEGAAVGVIVTFKDGDVQKAICSEDDIFNLETGFMVCAAKHAFYLAGYKETATKELNNTVEKIFKQYTKQAIAAADEEANKAAIEYRKAKRFEKKKRRMERKAAAEREKQVDIQAEAFLRAMRQFEKEKND